MTKSFPSSSEKSRPQSSRIGVVCINIGTPDAPTPPAVRRYLRDFLSDGRVVDLPAAIRWLLLNLIILPTRPKESAKAYQKIWTDEGSPLLVYSQAFQEALQEALGPQYEVQLGMMYSKPRLEEVMQNMLESGIEHIIAFPLYPHYASSSTGTSLQKVYEVAGKLWNVPAISVVPPFYDDPATLRAMAQRAQPVIQEMNAEHVLFSFHGLPKRHVTKTDRGNHCLASKNCCDVITEANRYCYSAQCYATAKLLAKELALEPGTWTVSFQSRLSERDPWITPFTDQTIEELAKTGTRRLAVVCPAFVADCLETLEEIGIQRRSDFLAAGGDDLQLVPSLNSEALWIQAAADLVHRATPTGLREPNTAVASESAD